MKIKDPFKHHSLSLKSIKKDINHGLKNIGHAAKYTKKQFDKAEKGIRKGVEITDQGIEYLKDTGIATSIPFGSTVLGVADMALDGTTQGLKMYEHWGKT